MKLISWIFIAALALVVIILSVGNKAPVVFSLYPLPFEMELPLYILILAGAFIGVLLGSVRTWIADGKARSENRAHKQEVLRLKAELAKLEAQQSENRSTDEDSRERMLKITEVKQT
ncbi:LapA family protein [Sneathiella glossodoripedis]|uniref:LapA family protein n=1 Tax=Sneathiella glossodoripedis TaxID=418853 RepID=UPI00047226CE|nr:LapA family protein [Sneathiella glossodoripedis]